MSGQDGGYLASLLLEKGYEVHGTSREPSRASFSAIRSLGIADRVDVHAMTPTDFSSVLTLLRHVEADEIYNLSGQSSVGLSFRQSLEPPWTRVEQVDQFLDVDVEEVDRMRGGRGSGQQMRERAVCTLSSPRLDVDGGECVANHSQVALAAGVTRGGT